MTSFNNATDRINNATDKIIDYLFKKEDEHFLESLEDEDRKDPIKFIAKLREHVFYSVVVLKFQGNAKALNDWVNEYWGLYGEPDEDEDEIEDDSDDEECCGCWAFGDDGCKCECHSKDKECSAC